MTDEDKEDNERNDGDCENNNTKEQSCAGFTAVHTVSAWFLSCFWGLTGKTNRFTTTTSWQNIKHSGQLINEKRFQTYCEV